MEGLLTNIMVGVIIFSVFAVGFGMFVTDIKNSYYVPQDETSIETFSKFQAITNKTNEINDQIQNADIGASTFFLAPITALSALRIAYNTVITVPLTIVREIGISFGIPSIITNAVVAILTLTIAMFIASALFKWWL